MFSTIAEVTAVASPARDSRTKPVQPFAVFFFFVARAASITAPTWGAPGAGQHSLLAKPCGPRRPPGAPGLLLGIAPRRLWVARSGAADLPRQEAAPVCAPWPRLLPPCPERRAGPGRRPRGSRARAGACRLGGGLDRHGPPRAHGRIWATLRTGAGQRHGVGAVDPRRARPAPREISVNPHVSPLGPPYRSRTAQTDL